MSNFAWIRRIFQGTIDQKRPARPALTPPHVTVSVVLQEFRKPELPNEAKVFEAGLMKAIGDKIDKHFCTHVVGATFKNEDGTDRQSLIAQCKEFQPVYLNLQPDHVKYSDAVFITADLPGPKLGYLDAYIGAQISHDVLKNDRVWGGLVRVVTKATPGKPSGMVICVMRFKPEYEEPYRIYPRQASA